MKITEKGQGLCEYVIGNVIIVLLTAFAAFLRGEIDYSSFFEFVRAVLACVIH